MSYDRKHLVAACKRKDPQALKQLYVELAPAMLGVCMRYTHSRDEAQDLLHDGFIKAFETIGKLRNPEVVEVWLRRIMVSVSVDYVMRNNRLVYCDMERVADTRNLIAEEDLDLDNLGEKVDQIIDILQSLPSHYRIVFNMRAVEEMEFDEIAATLHIPVATVRSYVARARNMIKNKINEKGTYYE